MAEYINKIFANGGLLANHVINYVPRPAQIDLAKKIDAAILQGQHCLAEAPCGTGKTWAYCIPAIAHACANKLKVVVATANIALQEQIVNKDLPFLQRVLPFTFSYALLKGRNNYFCKERASTVKILGRLQRKRAVDREALELIFNWANRTATGDKSELGFEPDPLIWRTVSATSEDCKHINCPKYDSCFFTRAKNIARNSHLTVTNYHMLFAHIEVQKQLEVSGILPNFDVLICDEAHEMADIARNFMGYTISKQILQPIIKWLQDKKQASQEQKKLAETLSSAIETFFTEMHTVGRLQNIRLRTAGWAKRTHENLIQSLAQCAQIAAIWTANEEQSPQNKKIAADVLDRCKKISWGIEQAVNLNNTNCVYWIDIARSSNVTLHCKPIDVSEEIKTAIFEKTRTAIITSATLTTNNNFEFIKKDLGIPAYVAEISTPAPFNYAEQSLFVVPKEAADIKDKNCARINADIISNVIKACRGRTLCLFTSIKNMQEVYHHVAERNLGYTLLMQGKDASRHEIYETFKNDITSCLFGVASFWTGVDIPGQALTGLVIDKLPFPNMSDPLINAMNERDRNSFWQYMVPKAIITLKQGLGRLIRSTSDYGVIVMLDKRLISRNRYSKQFLASLPPMQGSINLNDIEHFLHSKERR